MGRVERGHFRGFWTFPAGHGYDEHPTVGYVPGNPRRTWIDHCIDNIEPVITQRVFNDEGFLCFVHLSFYVER